MAFNHLRPGQHDALRRISTGLVTDWLPMKPRPDPPATVLDRLTGARERQDRLTHTEHLPPRAARHAAWPPGVRPEIVAAVEKSGIAQPWTHQTEAADLALD